MWRCERLVRFAIPSLPMFDPPDRQRFLSEEANENIHCDAPYDHVPFHILLTFATRQCFIETLAGLTESKLHTSILSDTGKNPGSIRTHTFAVACKIVGETAIFEKARYYNGFPIYSRAFKGLCDFCRCELAVVEALHVPWLSYHVPAIEQCFLGLMVGNSLKHSQKGLPCILKREVSACLSLRSPDSSSMERGAEKRCQMLLLTPTTLVRTQTRSGDPEVQRKKIRRMTSYAAIQRAMGSDSEISRERDDRPAGMLSVLACFSLQCCFNQANSYLSDEVFNVFENDLLSDSCARK